MDLDQLGKRFEWLDEERRRDKNLLAALDEKVNSLDSTLPGLSQQIKLISSNVDRVSALLGRFDQLDSTLGQMRVDLGKSLEALEKTHSDRENELEKKRRAEMDVLNKSITELKKSSDLIVEMRKNLQLRVEEDFRLSKLIEENDGKITDINRADEEYHRNQRLIEEGRRRDSKRLTDIQGELTALRKRQDGQGGKIEVSGESSRKLEAKLIELAASENERRQAQNSFFEKQALIQVERDRTWKDWEDHFTAIVKMEGTLKEQLQTLEETYRSVKRSQDAFDEITQKFDRRVNEITEMQRLNEDRIRQDWNTFKTEDQKRWSNYSLSQEEERRDEQTQFSRLQERVILQEEKGQELQDKFEQVNDALQKRLQSLMTMTHDWAENLEKMAGRFKR